MAGTAARPTIKAMAGDKSSSAGEVKDPGFFASLKNDTKKVLTGAKPRIFVLSLGAGVTPAEGSSETHRGFHIQ
jgi:hypothetical protein